MLATVWWVWLSAALALATLEVLVPGYIFLGFAVGAAIVALLLLLVQMTSLPLILVIFAALSLMAYLAMRRVFGIPGDKPKVWDRDIND
ncbi:NfeD family protein [Loktanella sp. DJP18]|uniref:NfeD family protein n=1 Tax=Loktanella sp. DJP18 TaxID=3409788 RepID=UPI003BB514C3